MAITPFEQASFNLLSFSDATVDLFDSTPKDVAIQQKDHDGNVSTKTIENRGKFQQKIWDDVGAALGQFDRTFYVDAENGSDTNDGSSSSPFQSIKKAVDSMPVGGQGVILFREGQTFTLTDHISVVSKGIKFFRWGNTSDVSNPVITSQEHASNTTDYIYSFQVSRGVINVARGVDILIPNHTGTNSIDNVYRCLFLPLFDDFGYADISFHYNSITLNKDFRLIDSHNWGGGTNLTITQLCGVSIEINNSSTPLIASSTGSPLILHAVGVPVKDNTGNNKTFNDLIANIIKDSNGVPRNIVSNIIF